MVVAGKTRIQELEGFVRLECIVTDSVQDLSPRWEQRRNDDWRGPGMCFITDRRLGFSNVTTTSDLEPEMYPPGPMNESRPSLPILTSSVPLHQLSHGLQPRGMTLQDMNV